MLKRYLVLGCVFLLSTQILVACSSKESNTDESSYSTESDNFVAPDNTLPKDLASVKSLVESTIKATNTSLLSVGNSDDNVFVIERNKDSSTDKFYIEYSEVYDCTTIKTALDAESPVKILYHYEYNKSQDMINELLEFILNYSEENDVSVDMFEDEDGNVKVSIE